MLKNCQKCRNVFETNDPAGNQKICNPCKQKELKEKERPCDICADLFNIHTNGQVICHKKKHILHYNNEEIEITSVKTKPISRYWDKENKTIRGIKIISNGEECCHFELDPSEEITRERKIREYKPPKRIKIDLVERLKESFSKDERLNAVLAGIDFNKVDKFILDTGRSVSKLCIKNFEYIKFVENITFKDDTLTIKTHIPTKMDYLVYGKFDGTIKFYKPIYFICNNCGNKILLYNGCLDESKMIRGNLELYTIFCCLFKTS